MVGLFTMPVLLGRIYGHYMTIGDYTIYLYDSNDSSNARLSILGWILGGILVGFGTKMGNGCTSGHGVCGLPRLAPRSIVATITFMAFGMLIATWKYKHPFLD